MLRRPTPRHNRGRIATGGAPAFSPVNIASLLGWWDAANATDAGSGVMGTIPESFVSGPALAAAGAPAIEAAGWGDGSQSVLFDGSSDYATVDSLAGEFDGADAPFTLIMRSEIVTWGDYEMLFSVGNSSDSDPTHYLCMRNASTPGKWESFRKDDAAAAVTVTGATDASATADVHTHALVFNGTQVSLFVDGAAAGITNPTAQNVGALTLDRVTLFAYRRTTTGLHGNVRLRAAGLFGAALSAEDREAMEAWVLEQYPES